ncbi:hypothetical protein SAMN04487970_10659 [Paenibacillus tianmuensis]|uniref:Glycosyl transferase family 8 n=1 Tax=Paenibacillus tianmuensis TaxID=624147 RepID=A0A1G4TSH7_9BACL|nr:DUF6492 family protein [Paenibacillus tianmuensis]SCW84311.1 hypothetical protein SAMN04487970_10659 [Paenibacillus tianmuensis]
MSLAPSRSRSGRIKIDVLMPAIDKDLETLPFVIDAIRKQVKHPIGKIMIVSPDSPRIKALCAQKKCTFVHERTVLPITKKQIRYRSKRWERSGWMLQQLLKLSGDKLGSSRYFLTMDADTVLIRPHVFRQKGKPVFYCRSWSHPEYFRVGRKLLGRRRVAPSSFVAHYMLFEKAKLARMKKKIEARHGTRWYQAILRSIDRSKPFGFSEFELYGNYVYTANPGGVVLKKCLNKSFSQSVKSISAKRLKALARSFRSLSFHKRGGYSLKPKGLRR